MPIRTVRKIIASTKEGITKKKKKTKDLRDLQKRQSTMLFGGDDRKPTSIELMKIQKREPHTDETKMHKHRQGDMYTK